MPLTPRRTTTKLLRLHPEELARITARARACGQTPAHFIGETALGAIPKPRHHAATEAVLRDMARTGRCLDELARLAEATRHPALAQRARTAIDRHRAPLRQILQDRRRGTTAPDSAIATTSGDEGAK